MVGFDLNEVVVDEYGTLCIDDEDYDELQRSNEVEEEMQNNFIYERKDLNCNGNGSNEKSNVNDISVSNENILGVIGRNYPLKMLMQEKLAQDISEDDVLGMEFHSIDAMKIFYRK